MTDLFEVVEHRVCTVDDVPLHEGRVVRIDGRRIAVFNTESGWHAVDDVCTHMGGPLSDGMVADDSVACPLHERRFDLTTGRAIDHECGNLMRYPVEIRDDDVMLTVPMPHGREDEESETTGPEQEPEEAEDQEAPEASESEETDSEDEESGAAGTDDEGADAPSIRGKESDADDFDEDSEPDDERAAA